jgi:hypothetical protein
MVFSPSTDKSGEFLIVGKDNAGTGRKSRLEICRDLETHGWASKE